MKTWMILTGIFALLLIASFVIAINVSTSTAKVSDTPKITSCESCQGKCTQDNNCGKTGCAAMNGGACNCSSSSEGCGCKGTGSCGQSGCQAKSTGSCGCGK